METTLSKNPFLSILIKPTETFRKISSNKLNYIVLLFILGSIAQTTQKFWNVSYDTSFLSSLMASSLIAVALGWIGFYVLGVIIYYLGKIFGGKGNLKSSITVVAWSLVPSIIGLFVYIFCYIIYGDVIFRSGPSSDLIVTSRSIFFYVRLALGLWSLYILFRGFIVINGFFNRLTKPSYS
jgi:hypothetical protein